MKQILQYLDSGRTEIANVAVPAVRPGCLLIRTRRTLISSGTERMLLEFGRASYLGKARQQPDKVREVLDKIRTDGLLPTIDAVRSKLDRPLPLGYCNAGSVVAVGDGVEGFSVGDRVVSNGPHAEYVSVPVNLCARIPDGVSDDAAAFTVLGSIALQGVRLIQPTLGESIVVTGLGLIGLLAVQILKANGCRVLGLDFDPAKLELAHAFGAETLELSAGADPVQAGLSFSRGHGVDGVLLTAATTSSEPVAQAAQMCRTRGRVVLVGVTGLRLSRADFYKKEISFQVSCSYGPGRHDTRYEDKGHDYPIGHVRWTEQRNFQAILDLLAEERIDHAPLVTGRFEIHEAAVAYDQLAAQKNVLALLIDFPEAPAEQAPAAIVLDGAAAAATTPAAVSFVGAGAYAGRTLIPAFQRAGARLETVVSQGGVSAAHFGRKYRFRRASTDLDDALNDNAPAIVIATRHDEHALLTCAALRAGKHVFVEKPLALTIPQLDEVAAAHAAAREAGNPALVMVGFNRRFAPHVMTIKKLLANIREPRTFVMTVNAGAIPREHWTQDPAIGGGRIIGEACHFVDLLRHLAHSPITRYRAMWLNDGADRTTPPDTATLALEFEDGSLGTIHYLANGHKSFAKERLEVFTAGRVLQLDNFIRLRGFGWPGFRKQSLWRQDKGQNACAQAFVDAITGGATSPIPFAELLEVSRVTVELAADR